VKRTELAFGAFVLLSLLSLVGCRSDHEQVQYLYREAKVDNIVVEFVGAGPVAADAVITGTVPEACAEVDEIRQVFDERERTFILTVTTRRPVDEPCEQMETTFEETEALAIAGLPDGVYTVAANGVSTTFRLERGGEVSPQ
jgi:hypothetical protein